MYLNPQQRCALDEPTCHTFRYDPIEVNETAQRIAMRINSARERLKDCDKDCCETEPHKFGCREASLHSDEDDSLCGIEFVGSDDEETSKPKSASASSTSHESFGSFEDCHGILLQPKRAIGHRDNHERRVSFPPPSPKVQQTVRASGASADISDEISSGFLNRIFSKMQFACGSPYQVVDVPYESFEDNVGAKQLLALR